MAVVLDSLAGKQLRPWQAQLEGNLNEKIVGKVLWVHNRGSQEGVSAWVHHWLATHPADVYFDADIKVKDVQTFYTLLHKGKKERPAVVLWEYKKPDKGTIKDKTSYNGMAVVKDGCHYDLRLSQGQIFWAEPHVVVFSTELPDTTKIDATKVVVLTLEGGVFT